MIWHESAMDLHVFPILIPPPTSLSIPSHSSGSSQCTSPEHLSHASNLGWWSVLPLIVYLFQCCSLRTSQYTGSFLYISCAKKKMLSNPWFTHPDTSQTAQKKVLKNDSQRKMTHYLHVYFSLLRFFKICMIVKSKNDKIVWWDFQNMYYEIHTTTTK